MERKIIEDKHALYLASVQDPISDIQRIDKIYREQFGKKAVSMREDFCGTFALSCCWVQSDDERSAISIDIDHETIEYGKKNYLANLDVAEQQRLEIIEGNSISTSDKVDVIATFNFSYCLLHKRTVLVEYFKKCFESLNDEGFLIMDIFGGSESEVLEVQERDIDNNDYISPFVFEFERKSFNPVNRRAEYAIHFRYPDGPQLESAYTYDFRMWTISELRDCLEEAGFLRSVVYWEGFDEEGFGNGEFSPTESEENTYNWNAYVLGIK